MKAMLTRWAETLGLTGTVGVGIAVFCAAFYAGTIRPGEQRLAELRVENARLERIHEQRTRQGAVAVGGSFEERLLGFYKLLASEQSIGELLATIDAIARQHGVILRQGTYRFSSEAGSRFGRYEVSYTGQPAYFQARLFLRDVLREMPMVSLDEVSFQRQQTTAGAIDMTARFSMLVRREP